MGSFISKKILITGGAGFVGSKIAFHLSQIGHQVMALDNLSRRGSELNIPHLRKRGIPFFHGDIRCSDDFKQVPLNVDLVIDCSAQPSVVSGFVNPHFDIHTNVMGTLECLEFCRKTGSGFIFFSSNRIYSSDKLNALPIKELETRYDYDPSVKVDKPGFDAEYGISHIFNLDGNHKSIYGVGKAAADLLCQEWASAFDMPIVINRCGVISGEGQFGKVDQGWVTWWVLAAYLGLPVKYFGFQGKQVRDILFIEDLCNLVDFEIRHISEFSGNVYNVGGGRENSLSLIEATSLVEDILKVKMNITKTNEARKDDIRIYLTDNRHVKRRFGWQQKITVAEGLEKIVKWVHNNGEHLKKLYL